MGRRGGGVWDKREGGREGVEVRGREVREGRGGEKLTR